MPPAPSRRKARAAAAALIGDGCLLTSACVNAPETASLTRSAPQTTRGQFERYTGPLFSITYPDGWRMRRGDSMHGQKALFEVVGQRRVHHLAPIRRVYKKPSTIHSFDTQLDLMRGFANMKPERKTLQDRKITVPGARRAQLIENTLPRHVVNGTPKAIPPPEGTPGNVVVPIHRIMLVAQAPDKRLVSLMFMAPKRLWPSIETESTP